MHDPTKVLLGATLSTSKTVTDHLGEIEAGLAVKRDSADALSLTTGGYLGISLGSDLGKAKRTAVLRKGLLVPIQLTDAFVPAIGAQVNLSDTTGKAGTAGAGFTAVNAEYASAVLTGVRLNADGTFTEVNVALIDMAGGL